MSPHYYNWQAQSQATHELFIMMFLFGVVLMLGYLMIDWLNLKQPTQRIIRFAYLAIMIQTIAITMAGPWMIDQGILQ